MDNDPTALSFLNKHMTKIFRSVVLRLKRAVVAMEDALKVRYIKK
jgi:hypothetical protein